MRCSLWLSVQMDKGYLVIVTMLFQPRHHRFALGGMMSFFRANQPVVLAPGEGTHLDVLGDLITLLVSGKQTNGAFTVLSET